MISFPYIGIIENAPTPLIIIFGMAHAAMGWVIYVYAKDLYCCVGKWMIKKEFTSNKMKRLWNREIGEHHLSSTIREVSETIYGSEKHEHISEVARLSYTAHIGRAIIFLGCWAIISSIKYFYMHFPLL